MKIVSKILTLLFIALLLSLSNIAFSTEAHAEDEKKSLEGTILPYDVEKKDVQGCRAALTELYNSDSPKSELTSDWDTEGATYLACGIKTGQMKLWMVPFYIRFMLEFVIQVSGLACVAATVYGGFLYLFAGVSEDKDKGKKAITYGIIGMVITFLAWAIVNIFIMFISGA